MKEYTEQNVADLEALAPVDNDKALAFADEYGFSVASVRAKAVRMGIYQAKPKVRKDGTAVERKSAIVADIAKLVGVDAVRLESMENATRDALVLVRAALQR